MLYSLILLIVLYLNLVSLGEIEDSADYPDYQQRIAFGDWADSPGSYPYFVSIQRQSWRGSYHICGGAFITNRIIITAAHCLSYPINYKIVPNYRNRLFTEPSNQTFKTIRCLIHPQYNHEKALSDNDIALCLLDRPDPRPNAVLKLPSRRVRVRTRLTIIGFGLIEGDHSPTQLREADVYVLPDYVCNRHPPYSSSTTICVTNNRGSAGCKGDSGGPLVWTNPRTNEQFVVGVLNIGGKYCGTYPWSVYADVYRHLYFVTQAIHQLSEGID